MKEQGMLKVTLILMLIVGILSAILGIVAILEVSALALGGEGMGLLYVSVALVILSAVIQIIAGAKGMGATQMKNAAAFLSAGKALWK